MRRLSVFFEARAGRRYGFLYRDWLDDHTGTGLPSPYDEELQPADPARHLFPLWKTYQSSADEAAPAPMRRRIFTPQAATLQVMRGDRLLQSQIDYQLQPRSGIIRLTEALAPDETLTAGFYFYVPVRFDVDRLNVDMVGSDLAQVTALPLIELPASELLE